MKLKPNYYAILQVDPHAEQEVIQAAYRRLAAKYHPDVAPSPGAVERMKLLNLAYEVLSDPERRKAYDLYHRATSQMEKGLTPRVPQRLQSWWLLPLAIVIVALAFRLSPRLLLVLGPLLLVLWLFWSRRSSSSS